jgi:putative FmdB family regulatory protein
MDARQAFADAGGAVVPRYEYQCEKCDHVTEVVRKVEDRDKTFICGQPAKDGLCMGTYKKIISTTGSPQFRGGGWTQKFF